MSTTHDGNAALQSSASDTHVENNLLDGGGCTLNFAHQSLGRPLTGIYIVGNRFGQQLVLRLPDPGQHANDHHAEHRQRLGRHR